MLPHFGYHTMVVVVQALTAGGLGGRGGNRDTGGRGRVRRRGGVVAAGGAE